MNISKFKEKFLRLISDARAKNPRLFLPIEDILKIIKRKYLCDHALRVLIPDYNEFHNICSRPVDSVQHESVVVMGIRNDELEILLNVIRQYILDGQGMVKASKQYVTDLSELHWWSQRTEAERYRVGNIYKGRIFELMLVSWLNEQGSTIINLEAWDIMSPDIVTEKDGLKRNIEVKYISQSKADFDQDCQTSLAPRFGTVDCTLMAENMLNRIDSATTQLQGRNDGLRVVALVVDNQSVGAYFISQATCCRNSKEVIDFQKLLYSRQDMDEVWIYTNQGLKVRPVYHYDIKNKCFTNYQSATN